MRSIGVDVGEAVGDWDGHGVDGECVGDAVGGRVGCGVGVGVVGGAVTRVRRVKQRSLVSLLVLAPLSGSAEPVKVPQ